jgi:hypothetical protein
MKDKPGEKLIALKQVLNIQDSTMSDAKINLFL